MLRFLILVLVLIGTAGTAVYFGARHWLPDLSNPQTQVDKDVLELLKFVPAALAAIIASLIAAGTSIVVVGLQLRANKELEDRRIKLLGELETKKHTLEAELDVKRNALEESLEQHRSRLAEQLDEKRQELSLQLSIKRTEIENKLNLLTEAREVVASYRHAIGALRIYGYQAEEIGSLEQNIVRLRDVFTDWSPELYGAWCDLHQKGFYLCERAQDLKTPGGRRRLWAQETKESGLPRGVEFSHAAERVLTLLNAEREKALQSV